MTVMMHHSRPNMVLLMVVTALLTLPTICEGGIFRRDTSASATCTVPAVSKGGTAELTCHFPQDIKQSERHVTYSVEHYPHTSSGDPKGIHLLDCTSAEECAIKKNHTIDGKELTMTIKDVTEDDLGKYVCQMMVEDSSDEILVEPCVLEFNGTDSSNPLSSTTVPASNMTTTKDSSSGGPSVAVIVAVISAALVLVCVVVGVVVFIKKRRPDPENSELPLPPRPPPRPPGNQNSVGRPDPENSELPLPPRPPPRPPGNQNSVGSELPLPPRPPPKPPGKQKPVVNDDNGRAPNTETGDVGEDQAKHDEQSGQGVENEADDKRSSNATNQPPPGTVQKRKDQYEADRKAEGKADFSESRENPGDPQSPLPSTSREARNLDSDDDDDGRSSNATNQPPPGTVQKRKDQYEADRKAEGKADFSESRIEKEEEEKQQEEEEEKKKDETTSFIPAKEEGEGGDTTGGGGGEDEASRPLLSGKHPQTQAMESTKDQEYMDM